MTQAESTLVSAKAAYENPRLNWTDPSVFCSIMRES